MQEERKTGQGQSNVAETGWCSPSLDQGTEHRGPGRAGLDKTGWDRVSDMGPSLLLCFLFGRVAGVTDRANRPKAQ